VFLLAFWVSFATDSSKNPMDETGMKWPKYSGRNGSIVVFGDDEDDRASQVESVDVMNAVYPLAEC
jgi:hypothetical protein